MQLDKTRIRIRERGLADILDLALRVVRAHAGPLIVLAAFGAAPWVLINHWLLSEDVPSLLSDEVPGEERFGAMFGYSYVLTILLMIEAPLATAPITLFLGQALFTDHFDKRRLARDFLRSLPQLLLLRVLPLIMIVPWVVTWFLPYVFWPYLGEIILLEQNPLFRRGKPASTTLSRARALHVYSTGDLFVRWLVMAALAPLLTVALWLGLWSVCCIVSEDWTFTAAAFNVLLPVAVWCVVSLLAVVRFLSYLDQRIRSEGWEIELMMRAEAVRLTGQVA